MKHLILLDRSGSMVTRWSEVTSALQEYVNGIPKDDIVKVVAFDSSDSYEFVTEGTGASFSWNDSVKPRSMTPLYDALGNAYNELASESRAVLIVITDGLENSSTEYTKSGVSALLEKSKAQGVETIFISANFENFSDAQSLGMDATKTVMIADQNYAGSLRAVADKTSMYSRGLSADALNFSDEERTAFRKE